MSENNPLLNGPDRRRDDDFGLPPTSGQPSIPTGHLPPSELAAVSAPPSASVLRSPPPAPPSKKAESPKHDESVAGMIDTFEAIIIALILALTFRAFVVEAFVIPTGSMAPTLLGAHFQVICPKCGYAFSENANLGNQAGLARNTRGELVDSRKVFAEVHRYCPNCGTDIAMNQLPDVPDSRSIAVDSSPRLFPWANNGDRILVLKYLYSVMSPQRYDVIVFKEPMLARDNFIKRLIGLPGETVEIIGGDIYAGGTEPDQRFITRKPRHVQDALWQIVYDNDFYPIDEGQARTCGPEIPGTPKIEYVWRNPWSGPGWKVSRNEIRCDPAGGTLSFLPGEVTQGQAFYGRNITGYNSEDVFEADRGLRDYVGDLHLETVWMPEGSGDAAISMTLGKANNRWRATLQADGSPRLERWNDKSKAFVEEQPQHRESVAPAGAGDARRVAMSNVDRRVELCVDGKLVLSYETTWTAADAIAALGTDSPRDAEERPMVSIATTHGCRLAHLKLMRDLYYTQAGKDHATTGRGLDGRRTAFAGNPLTLGPDEFFALGDNSTASLDGRMWGQVFPALDDLGTRPGIVPRRYLLGKAFFVYWPAGFRVFRQTFDRPVLNSPIIPNTGDMRLIR